MGTHSHHGYFQGSEPNPMVNGKWRTALALVDIVSEFGFVASISRLNIKVPQYLGYGTTRPTNFQVRKVSHRKQL
jgi:hypothetical protein